MVSGRAPGRKGKGGGNEGEFHGETNLLLRRQGPSGRFSGPTRKPLRAFLASGAAAGVASSARGRLGAMAAADEVAYFGWGFIRVGRGLEAGGSVFVFVVFVVVVICPRRRMGNGKSKSCCYRLGNRSRAHLQLRLCTPTWVVFFGGGENGFSLRWFWVLGSNGFGAADP